MNLLLTIAAMYALYAFITMGVIVCVQHRDRFPAIMIAIVFPVILVAAAFSAIGSKVVTLPCPDGLEEAEALVERQRQLMFFGKPQQPSIARVWRKRYAMSVELQALHMRKFSLEIKSHLAAI